MLDATVRAVRAAVPGYGVDVAIDGSDLPAYANGQRYLYNHGPERERFSDPDASWGHRSSVGTRQGGGYYGYKLHLAVCARTELPVAWATRTARDSELPEVGPLLDAMARRGVVPATAALDKNYDAQGIYAGPDRPAYPLGDRADRHGEGEARRAQAADLRARDVDVRGSRRQTAGDPMALPDEGVQARVPVGEV